MQPYEEAGRRPVVGEVVSVPVSTFSCVSDMVKAMQYALRWKDGSEPPPVQVRQGQAGQFIPIDGHHRATAARILGYTTIQAELVP